MFYAAVPDIGFDDLADCGYTLDTFFSEAEELARFVKQAARDGYDFIFQCEYGESRSAAACAAIREYYLHDGIKVFADYRFCPNQVIYNKLYEALCVN